MLNTTLSEIYSVVNQTYTSPPKAEKKFHGSNAVCYIKNIQYEKNCFNNWSYDPLQMDVCTGFHLAKIK